MATNVRALKDRAVELMGKRRFEKAAQAYLALCELEPKDPTLRHRLGDALRASGKTVEAVDAYRQAADRYGADGMLLKAIAVCKVILELEPSHTATQERLAALHAKRASSPRTWASAVPASAPVEIATVDLPEERAPADESPDESIEAILPPERSSEESAQASGDVWDESPRVFLPEEETPSDAPPPMPAAESAPLLVATPLFEALEPEAFVGLLKGCVRRPFQAGDVLLQQGDAAGSFFVLSEGRVRVVRELEDAVGERRTVELATLSEGAFFGELALLTSAPRFASVVGASEGEALEFPSPMLEDLQREHPAVGDVLKRFARARMLQNILATSPLFRPFDWEHRKQLIERFRQREVASGEVILREGGGGDGLYVVLQGRMRVTLAGNSLAALQEGDVFGEISLLSSGVATATVTAEGPARLLRLPREAFLELISTHPQALEVLSEIAEQRQQTNEALLSGAIAYDVEGLMLV